MTESPFDDGRAESDSERLETTEDDSAGFGTGAERPPQPAAEPAEPTLEEQFAERTADLQRLQAEYINYKRRVDRDRILIKAQGAESVLQSLLTVLDDIGRAAEHGELEGGFKAVADSLQQAVKGHKLETFGAEGDPFNPALHDAVMHAGTSPDVTVSTVDKALRPGYKVGERILRHATVSVVDPVEEPPVEPVETPVDDNNED